MVPKWGRGVFEQKIHAFNEVHSEILELKELTGRLNSPVVFAHNDLLSGNIMVNDDDGKLYFIDFEYGSYNYRGYDIGNHFNEYAGYDCDYSLYPSKDEQYHFIRHHLQPDKPHEAKMSPINFDYLGYFFLRYNEYKRQKGRWVSLARSLHE